MSDIRIGLVGAGQMGSNHARVVAASSRATLGVVIDVDTEKAKRLSSWYGATASSDLEAALQCDAVILATPTEMHAWDAVALIERGVPVMVEKPIANELVDTERICRTARGRGVVLACGFVERFNPVITAAMELLDQEEVMHVVTMRHSPAAPRIANSVVQDLLIHDIDIALRLMHTTDVDKVGGTSWIPPESSSAEIADCTLQFANGALATLSASRAGQRKLRSMQIFTSTLLLELDLLRADLTVYRNVRQEQSAELTYRAETIIDIPFVRHIGEPLALELEHFLDLVVGLADPTDEIEGILAPHRVAQRVELECGNAKRVASPQSVPAS